MSTGLTPNTREEQFLSAAAGETATSELPTPATRKEKYLNEIAKGGGSVYGKLEAGVNISIEETSDGKAKISATGEVSSEDSFARAEIEAIKDGISIDSFADVESALNNKVDEVQGKGLSTNDYTTVEKTKLAGIAEGAEVNVQSDWNQTTTTADDYIKNKPSIPTVNDSTITIQKNGTTVDSFTTNAASGKSINIAVPTTASDVNALPNTTKYAAAVDLSIDPSTFVVTIQLKDQNDDNIGKSRTIDLPLESVVVSGSYDSQTKKVVLILQSGSTVEFSVADLVAGLQSEITANNKLSSDLVDDANATHKFVTASEKTTWNSKQDALSQAQLSAVNSGATAAKIDQISTNQSDISLLDNLETEDRAALAEVIDNGAKNELSLSLAEMQSINGSGQGASWSGNVCTIAGITFTVNDDMTITVNGTLTGERALFRFFYNRANAWGGKILSGCPQGGSSSSYGMALEQAASPWGTVAQDYGNSSQIGTSTATNVYGYISIRQTVNNLTFKPMICTKAAWDISQKYVPYRPSYEDLSEQVETNENNILSLDGKLTAHTAGGANYDTINGIRVYVSSTAPTGNIPTGSIWIGG